MSVIQGYLIAFATWLTSILTYIPKLIYQYLTDAAISAIDSIFSLCSSCSLTGLSTTLGGLPNGIIWVLGWFNLGQGLAIIGGSYLIRFLIRRLPIFG